MSCQPGGDERNTGISPVAKEASKDTLNADQKIFQAMVAQAIKDLSTQAVPEGVTADEAYEDNIVIGASLSLALGDPGLYQAEVRLFPKKTGVTLRVGNKQEEIPLEGWVLVFPFEQWRITDDREARELGKNYSIQTADILARAITQIN